ncbi:MAG: nucleotide exchange factor GrpE, partial [Thermomicrobiales bacterium]|nr:nucleotide exchange factor GrpE [Thermomicrobiales bacterium]
MSEFTTHPGKDGVDGGDSAPGDNLELENELLEQSLGIAELAAERDRYLDQLQRTAAEFANYRRRTEQSLIQDRKNAARDLMVQIAPIMDDFERALANAPQDESQHVWVEGVRLIERKLAGLLERQDV